MNSSPGGAPATGTQKASAIELGASDLPAFCPNPRMPIWSSHPRVFLDVSHGEARCPYCGTAYRLKPGAVAKGY
jgi:uncharacterized Zn-finger protein